MIIRERVYEARLASRIARNPDQAKQFGIELGRKEEDIVLKNLDNRIFCKSKNTSTEA